MSRFLVASLVVCAVVVASASDAQAGLFGKRGGGRGHHGKASSGCTTAPTCSAPAPTCSAPVQSCGYSAPAPMASCGCSAPAPVSSCGCGSPAPVSMGCSSCGGGAVSYNGGMVSGGMVSGCANCSQTMNSGAIMESSAPQSAPPAPATSAPAAPTPDAAPSAPAAPAAPTPAPAV